MVSSAGMVLTTEKDLIKMNPSEKLADKLYALRIETNWHGAPPVVVSELLAELLRAASLKTDNGLTPQEARIQELTSKGYKNSAIAEALFISLETVRWHKRRLNRKLRGSSRLPEDLAIPSSHVAAAV